MSSRFNIIDTSLQGLRIIERKPIGDERGYIERMFCEDEFNGFLLDKKISQVNQTFTSKRGTVRGMHFQYSPHAETKVVSCFEGEIFDVAVDLRPKSSTYLQWYGEILSSDNHKSFVIPEGFAHGYQTLSDNCKMLYLHTAPYNQGAEGGVRATDLKLKIDWPLPLAEISERDMSHPLIDDTFLGIDI